MSACEALTANASLGVAPALRAVDCLANESTAAAFGRLFGGADVGGGALLPVLTILLTLYIAFFAISLLTGRSRLGISALTPRMMTLGLVLTFATSWVAYQGVVWNLATGAPDQIAGVLTGAQGSATQIFADRIDMIFAAIAEVGSGSMATQGPAPQGSGSFTPGNLMWLGGVLLLLGTVGVLVTARIALAVLLALGPIFVVMALFPGTRGLTAGWLRGLVLTAVTPLFVVLGGGMIIEMIVPVVAQLRGETGVDGRAALALFMIASVHVALMMMVLKVAGTMVVGWSVFGLDRGKDSTASDQAAATSAAAFAAPAAIANLGQSHSSPARRTAATAAMMPLAVEIAPQGSAGSAQGHSSRTVVTQIPGASPHTAPLPAMRGRGIGSRFRSPSPQFREKVR